MLSNRKLKHTTAGLLGKFIGRNNDYDGYWALGTLYMEARDAGNRIELDLLTAGGEPATPACLGLARTWSGHLRDALLGHGGLPDDLAGASISLEFGLLSLQMPPYSYPIGDPFRCTLRLVASDGRVVERQALGRCFPLDRFWGSRSTRRAG